MRHISRTEKLTVPPTDEERDGWVTYSLTAGPCPLSVYVIRRREARGEVV